MGCCHSDNRSQKIAIQVVPKKVKAYGNDPEIHGSQRQEIQK